MTTYSIVAMQKIPDCILFKSNIFQQGSELFAMSSLLQRDQQCYLCISLTCFSFPEGKEHEYRGDYKTQKFLSEKLGYKSVMDYL